MAKLVKFYLGTDELRTRYLSVAQTLLDWIEKSQHDLASEDMPLTLPEIEHRDSVFVQFHHELTVGGSAALIETVDAFHVIAARLASNQHRMVDIPLNLTCEV